MNRKKVIVIQIFDNLFLSFKKDLSTRKTLIRFIPRKRMRLIYLLLLISLVVGELASNTDNNYFIIPFVICIAVLMWYVKKEINNIRIQKYGTNEDYQKKRYDILISILKQNSLYDDGRTEWTINKIEMLIQICNVKLSKPKFSARTLSFLGVLLAVVTKVLPLSELKKILTTLPGPLEINIITIFIQVLGLLLIITPIIFELADRKYTKIEELRNMLYEINLIRL